MGAHGVKRYICVWENKNLKKCVVDSDHQNMKFYILIIYILYYYNIYIILL